MASLLKIKINLLPKGCIEYELIENDDVGINVICFNVILSVNGTDGQTAISV